MAELQISTIASVINYFIEAVAREKVKSQDFKLLCECSCQRYKERNVQISCLCSHQTCLSEAIESTRVKESIFKFLKKPNELHFRTIAENHCWYQVYSRITITYELMKNRRNQRASWAPFT